MQRGESLFSIAKKNRVTLKEIQGANPAIRPPYRLQPGMQLTIPKTEKRRAIYVNGYVFPQKNTEELQSVFPYITYLSIFSYHARPDGSLIPIDDSALIQIARRSHVAPMMVITNMDEAGRVQQQSCSYHSDR